MNATINHDRIITPDSDPDRWTEREAAVFRLGRCPWQIDPARLAIEDEYCYAPSKPGASFGHCAEHEAELLVDHFPDGTPRRNVNPWYDKAPDYQMRLAAWTALLPDDGDDELAEVPSHRNDLGDWCPRSGERTADGTCPLYCHDADVQVGFDAGDREADDDDEQAPDTLRELRDDA